MISRLLVFALSLGVLTALGQTKPERIAPLQRSVSSSQQFVIYHPDRALRSRLARRVEDLKSQWLRRLRLADEWKSPIVIQILALQRPDSSRTRTGLYEGDGGALKVQIDVRDVSSLQSAEFDLEVYRALFLEYAYRDLPSKAGKSFHQPPSWLIEGLYEDVTAREEGVAAGLYDQVLKQGNPPKLEVFLKERPEILDATSRAIYRALSLGLLRAVLRTPDGAKHLAEYCSGLSSINPADDSRLLEAFPMLSGRPAVLSKLWTLSLAEASASNRILPLPVGETQKRLALILEISTPADPRRSGAGVVSGPEALEALARAASGRYILRQKAEDLLRLEVRAHPLMRPIVEEYRLIAARLAAKPRKSLEARIRKNMQLQQAVVKRSEEMEDYLNWFEAARLDTPSKEFDSELDLESSSPGVRRNDAVSRTLDDVDARGW